MKKRKPTAKRRKKKNRAEEQPEFRRGERSGGVRASALGEFGEMRERATFRIERILPGPIERAWVYLIEPDKRKKWFADGPMELRASGKVELQFRFRELTAEETPAGKLDSCEVPGIITRCEPHRVLSYTWGAGENASEVIFELSAREDDVLLVVTHRRLAPGAAANVASGWHAHLGLLEDVLHELAPRPFWERKLKLEAEYGKRFGKASL